MNKCLEDLKIQEIYLNLSKPQYLASKENHQKLAKYLRKYEKINKNRGPMLDGIAKPRLKIRMEPKVDYLSQF